MKALFFNSTYTYANTKAPFFESAYTYAKVKTAFLGFTYDYAGRETLFFVLSYLYTMSKKKAISAFLPRALLTTVYFCLYEVSCRGITAVD